MTGVQTCALPILQEQKDEGKTLTAEESQTLSEANTAAANVPTDGKTEGKNWMMWAAGGLAVILVVYLVMRKK